MKYIIKIVLECDAVVEKQWALGCVLGDQPTEAEKLFVKQELFKAVEAQARELYDDLPTILEVIK